MNNKVLKLTTLTALTMAFGTFAVVNTANADSGTIDTGIQQSAYTVQENAANYNETDAQQINFPSGYRLNDLRNVRDDASNQEFDQVARPGLVENNYQTNASAAAQSVDINQLNNQQVTEMNQYALDLVNNARASFGENQFTQNQGTINAVQEMAQQYQNNDESLLKGSTHDQTILKGDSENISAMQIYADNINGLRPVPFASAKGSDFVDQDRIPLFSISNMDDLRAMIFYGVTTMLFNDASDHYGHAQNFLTNYQIIPTMAVYPSITNGWGTGTVSDGSTFKYRLKNVDMHFIWAASETPQSLGSGWQKVNNRWYYYENNTFATNWRNVNGRWYYFLPNGAASMGWFQTAVGNWYYFDPTNAWADTGWQWINGQWYYFDGQGKMLTGRVLINGRYNNFDSNGHWLGYAD